MQTFRCQVCGATAFGAGGGYGLKAMGWHFEEGSFLFVKMHKVLCPLHHPSGVEIAKQQAMAINAMIRQGGF